MLSAIVTVGGDDPQRKQIFSLMLDVIAQQSNSDYELIVVEQYVNRPSYLSLLEQSATKYSYIAVHGDHFSRPWGLNIGARNSSGNVLAFMDADIIFSHDYFAQIVCDFQTQYSFGWSELIYLNEEGTELYKATRDYRTNFEDRLVDHKILPHPFGGAGLSTLYEREFFFRAVVGFNEAFVYNTANDNEMMMRTVWAAGTWEPMSWNTIDHCILHLHHGGRHTGDLNRALEAFTKKHLGFVTEKIRERGLGFLAGRRSLDLAKLQEEVCRAE